MHQKKTEASVDLDNIPILRTTCKWKKNEDGTYSTHRFKEDAECVIQFGQQPIDHFAKTETVSRFVL